MRRRRKDSTAGLGWLLVVFLLAVSAVPRKSRGGQQMTLTLEQLRELARAAGFQGEAVDVAAAVAMAESGGDTYAQGDPHGSSGPFPNGSSRSFGLWQIHSPSHPQFVPVDLLRAEYNAAAAHLVSKGGTDWSPWTTYRDGSYKKFMPAGLS